MKNILNFVIFFFSIFVIAQNYGTGKMTDVQYQDFTNFLKENNIPIRDSIFIKYDYNKENCWNALDGMGKKHILKIVENFQQNISDFNKNHQNSVAVNFRQPGKSFNKLKLWDSTILVDDKMFLYKLIFSKYELCGNSVLVLKDGSVVYRFSDPHFQILELSNKKLLHQF